MKIGLLVPSRGRPHNARKLAQTWLATSEGHSRLTFYVDSDDPTRDEYPPGLTVTGPPARLVEWTNRAALDASELLLGSIGDDHRFESARWESRLLQVLDELGGTGILYGDDGVHGERLPTAFFMTSNIVRARGHMIPPGFEHWYADDQARDLGRTAGCLRYVADVHIAHHHPLVGLASWDDTYERGNSADVQKRDRAAYEHWLRHDIDHEAALVRALKEG